MPHLHKAFERFKSSNFTIYSIATYDESQKVKKFREEKYKMPWFHSVLDRTQSVSIWKLLEVSGVPRQIIISPDGKIFYAGSGGIGDKLEKLLETYLE
jgi:hypothetical protein